MRSYFSLRPEQRGSFSPEELDVLDMLIRRITRRLHIDEQAERNEIAARILSLYELGRSPEDILDLTMRLYRHRRLRFDRLAPVRARTERQRRRPVKKED
jgi:hypothetical protein